MGDKKGEETQKDCPLKRKGDEDSNSSNEPPQKKRRNGNAVGMQLWAGQ